jgi:hypothetical protein
MNVHDPRARGKARILHTLPLFKTSVKKLRPMLGSSKLTLKLCCTRTVVITLADSRRQRYVSIDIICGVDPYDF